MLLPRTIRTYVFDLDNTLYDESLFVQGGTSSVINWTAGKFFIKEDILRAAMDSIMCCYPRGEWYQRYLEKLKIQYTEDLIDKMVDIYRKHTPNINLFPDAKKILIKIKKQKAMKGNIFLALITDGLVFVQKSKVNALGLNKVMDECVFTWAKGPEYQKPHAWSFEFIEKKTNTSGEECCYFGNDERKDFLAPNRLGWKTVGILREDKKPLNIGREYEPLWYVSSFDDLVIG